MSYEKIAQLAKAAALATSGMVPPQTPPPPPDLQPGTGAGPAPGPGGAMGGLAGVGSMINQGMASGQQMLGQAGGAIGGAVGGAANAVGGAVGAIPGGEAAGQWIQNNPGHSALLGAGGVGLGAGLYQLLKSKKKPKEVTASDRQAIVRKTAVVAFNNYLEKLASTAPPVQRWGLRQVQANLVMGKPLPLAMQRGFPKLAADARTKITAEFQKVAIAGVGTTVPTSFTGKPTEGVSWMRANC